VVCGHACATDGACPAGLVCALDPCDPCNLPGAECFTCGRSVCQ